MYEHGAEWSPTTVFIAFASVTHICSPGGRKHVLIKALLQTPLLLLRNNNCTVRKWQVHRKRWEGCTLEQSWRPIGWHAILAKQGNLWPIWVGFKQLELPIQPLGFAGIMECWSCVKICMLQQRLTLVHPSCKFHSSKQLCSIAGLSQATNALLYTALYTHPLHFSMP